MPCRQHEEVVLAALVVVEAADHARARERDVRLAGRLRAAATSRRSSHQPAALVLVAPERDQLDAVDHVVVRAVGADEVVDGVVRVDRLAGVAPEALEHVVLHRPLLDVPVVHVGDLELAAAGRLERRQHVPDGLVVEVDAGDRVLARRARPASRRCARLARRRRARGRRGGAGARGRDSRASRMRAPRSCAAKRSAEGRNDRSSTLSASITQTRSRSTNRSASPSASAIPPGFSWYA